MFNVRLFCYYSLVIEIAARPRAESIRALGTRAIPSSEGQHLRAAILATSGRTDAARAALLAAHGSRLVDRAVTLVRVVLPGEPLLPVPRTAPFAVLQRECRDAATAAAFARETAALADGDLMLDLPAACLGAAEAFEAVDVAVVTVGPTPLDEEAARIATAPDGRPVAVPHWLLACGRPGGAAAVARLDRTLRDADWIVRRLLPATVAPTTAREFLSLLEGTPTRRDAVGALALRRALEAAGRRDGNPGLDDAPPAFRAERRRVEDALRDLADELAAIAEGVRPTADDLADAPVLEGWERVARPLPALRGTAYGHPSVKDGHVAVTSDLYEVGPGWARTLSRYWRLGRRRDEAGETSH